MLADIHPGNVTHGIRSLNQKIDKRLLVLLRNGKNIDLGNDTLVRFYLRQLQESPQAPRAQ